MDAIKKLVIVLRSSSELEAAAARELSAVGLRKLHDGEPADDIADVVLMLYQNAASLDTLATLLAERLTPAEGTTN